MQPPPTAAGLLLLPPTVTLPALQPPVEQRRHCLRAAMQEKVLQELASHRLIFGTLHTTRQRHPH
jgi:hypothetical protein